MTEYSPAIAFYRHEKFKLLAKKVESIEQTVHEQQTTIDKLIASLEKARNELAGIRLKVSKKKE